MHPWLAGAQYRTTAVVLMYRLISLIGPHCPGIYILYVFLSQYALGWCAVERKKDRGGNVGGGEGERKGISYVHFAVVGARQSVHYLRNICLLIKHNAVP